MLLIPSAILWLFAKYCCCQSPCLKEPLDEKDFSISVAERIKEESGMCILIQYNLTVRANKDFIPYQKIWFEGTPSNIKSMQFVKKFESETSHTDKMDSQPPGEYEYGLKLKWGCNQTYIFPNRVKISVSAFTWKPEIWVNPLIEGKHAKLGCHAPSLCSGRANILWKWQKNDGQLIDIEGGYLSFLMRRDQTEITPTAEDHNSTITCVAEYREHVINSSVTLNVQFPPKIQRDSWCLVEGKLLVCVCTSRGNPLPPITWPLENLTDYSVRSLSSSQTVNSTFTLLAADYPNNTVKCISSNELAKEELEIPIVILTDSFRMTDSLDCSRTFDAALPWIAAVCFCLNVVLITILVVYIYKHRKSKKRKDDKTTDIYASLRKTDDDQEYSVISPQHR